MAVKNIYLLPVGKCDIDETALDTRLTPGKKTTLPIWAYLIETTEGPILVDTGMPPSCASDPLGLFKAVGVEDESIVPRMHEEDRIDRVLQKAGYQPEDLACIINTHLHFDHAGGNTLFPKTDILLQKTEYDAAMNSADYFDICKDPNLNYKLIDGDFEVVPGLSLLSTPGHSPGHQSLLVRTEKSGTLLLTVDASYCRANYEDLVPFAAYDQSLATQSISRLKTIAKEENAYVFFGHDQHQPFIEAGYHPLFVK